MKRSKDQVEVAGSGGDMSEGELEKANLAFAEASRAAANDPSYGVEGMEAASKVEGYPGKRGVPLREGERSDLCPDCWEQFHEKVRCKKGSLRTWSNYGGTTMGCFRGHAWGYDNQKKMIVDADQRELFGNT